MFFRLFQTVHLSFSVIAHPNREKSIRVLERESVFLNYYHLYYYFEQKHMIHRLEGMGGYWLPTYMKLKYRDKLQLCMEKMGHEWLLSGSSGVKSIWALKTNCAYMHASICFDS